jgi:hypothetical protein
MRGPIIRALLHRNAPPRSFYFSARTLAGTRIVAISRGLSGATALDGSNHRSRAMSDVIPCAALSSPSARLFPTLGQAAMIERWTAGSLDIVACAQQAMNWKRLGRCPQAVVAMTRALPIA